MSKDAYSFWELVWPLLVWIAIVVVLAVYGHANEGR